PIQVRMNISPATNQPNKSNWWEQVPRNGASRLSTIASKRTYVRSSTATPPQTMASRLLKNYSPSTGRCVTKRHARSGRAAESDIQLLVAGSTGAEGSSAAGDPDHGRRGAGPDVWVLWRHVCRCGTAVDCAGE